MIPPLAPNDRTRLLALARTAATDYLSGKPSATYTAPSVLGVFGGAFATFWKTTTLRGCVGSFATTQQIERTIAEVTRASLKDPRFAADPITIAELPRLRIELSVLSHLEPTSNPGALRPGTHGIVVERGAQRGCFLPKVATDKGWSAEEFLDACCTMKAGLPHDAWRKPGTQIYLFTVHAFSDDAPDTAERRA